MPLRLQDRWGALLLALAAAVSACDGSRAGPTPARDAAGPGGAAPAAADAGISLEVAVVLGAPGGALSLTLRNHQATDLETTPIATNYNRLLITAPDGKRIEHVRWKDGVPTVLVKAHGEQSWRLELGQVLDLHGLKDAGTYRLQWQVGSVTSSELLFLRE